MHTFQPDVNRDAAKLFEATLKLLNETVKREDFKHTTITDWLKALAFDSCGYGVIDEIQDFNMTAVHAIIGDDVSEEYTSWFCDTHYDYVQAVMTEVSVLAQKELTK
jgi:hypothetical protein